MLLILYLSNVLFLSYTFCCLDPQILEHLFTANETEGIYSNYFDYYYRPINSSKLHQRRALWYKRIRIYELISIVCGQSQKNQPQIISWKWLFRWSTFKNILDPRRVGLPLLLSYILIFSVTSYSHAVKPLILFLCQFRLAVSDTCLLPLIAVCLWILKMSTSLMQRASGCRRSVTISLRPALYPSVSNSTPKRSG